MVGKSTKEKGEKAMIKKLKDCTLSDLIRTCSFHYNGKRKCKGCPFSLSSFCAVVLSPVTIEDWERDFNITEEA